jgi:hypothetical protein
VALAAFVFALLSVFCGVIAMAGCMAWLLVPYMLCAVLTLGCAMAAWGSRRAGWRNRLWAGAGVALVFVFFAVALYATAILHTRERNLRAASAAQLQASGKAMQAYYRHHGRFPPAALRDNDGKPLLSWRVALLPFLGQQALFDRFHLHEPWDSAHNHALLAEMPPCYSAPHRTELPPYTTVYQVLVGPGTAFDPAAPLQLPPTDFPGGAQELFVIVEAAEAVPWTKPDDLMYASDAPLPGLGSVLKYALPPVLFVPTPGRWMLAADAAGGVHWMNLDATDEETIRRSIARADRAE